MNPESEALAPFDAQPEASTTGERQGWCVKCGARPTTPEHKRPDGSDCPYLATGLAGMAVLDGEQR